MLQSLAVQIRTSWAELKNLTTKDQAQRPFNFSGKSPSPARVILPFLTSSMALSRLRRDQFWLFLGVNRTMLRATSTFSMQHDPTVNPSVANRFLESFDVVVSV